MSSNVRKIFRVFLASPGDLTAERQAIRNVVLEFNDSWADGLGYQVELDGWEDTISGYGRPQEIINQDVDRCDLFIGLLWKRWGTPPSTSGRYSSGFEEEFKRSLDRCQSSSKPEIALFFKVIPDEFFEDPGSDLTRVLDFKNDIVQQKNVLYQNFSTTPEMEQLARKCLATYVSRAKAIDVEPDDIRTKPRDTTQDDPSEPRLPADSSPLSAHGSHFLAELVDKLRQEHAPDDLSAFDIARFRLLASSISKPGNDDIPIGVHDLNLLYSAQFLGVTLGARETLRLLQSGFHYFSTENVPIWRWYAALSKHPIDVAIPAALTGDTDEERIGAIAVLTALGREFSFNNTDERRHWFVESWFSETSPASVRTAALKYLKKMGTVEDYFLAEEEYDRNDGRTSNIALECMTAILMRSGQLPEMYELLSKSSLESLDHAVLDVLNDYLAKADSHDLLASLEHRNAQIRLCALKLLVHREAFNLQPLERMCTDADASVRYEALMSLSARGKSFTEDEARTILVVPKKRTVLGIPSKTSDLDVDFTGMEYFERYRSASLQQLSEPELTSRVEASRSLVSLSYFVRAELFFPKYGAELRHHIDDSFSTYFEDRTQRIETGLFTRTLLKGMPGQEEYHRKQLTRKGLDILCRKGKKEDLQQIRKHLETGWVGISKADVEYFAKHGEWSDIELLCRSREEYIGSIFSTGNRGEFHRGIAISVIKMSRRQSVAGLLALNIPPNILTRVIKLCPHTRFTKISREAFLNLLDHEAEDVRKAAVRKGISVFTVKQIRSILREYASDDKHRYYNVIHWLDLGASMSRADARKVVRSTMG